MTEAQAALPAPPRPLVLHATTVAIGGRAVVISGASGSGKSDLALRLIDRGAILIADDRTIIERDGDVAIARCPATIAGRIEVRGLGIVAMPHLARAPIALVVEIADVVERMPEPRTRSLAGVAVHTAAVIAYEASAAIKVERALAGAGTVA